MGQKEHCDVCHVTGQEAACVPGHLPRLEQPGEELSQHLEPLCCERREADLPPALTVEWRVFRTFVKNVQYEK